MSTRTLTTFAAAAALGVSALASSPAMAQEACDYTFHAGSIGGTFFIIGAAVTSAWQEELDCFEANVVPGGGFGNIIQVSRGADQLGLSTTPMLRDSVTGEGEFAAQGLSEGIDNVRALANMGYGATYQFIMMDDAVPEGVETLGDFLAMEPEIELGIAPRGTAGEIGVRRILDLYGVTYDDIESWGGSVQFADLNDAVDGLKDGRLEAFWENAPPYHPGITELAISRDIRLLPMDEDKIAAMTEQYGLPAYTIPAGVYDGIEAPTETVFEGYIIIANADLDDAKAQEMTGIILDNKPRWVQAFRGLEAFDPATAMQSPVPLHAGAEAAFRERGLID